MRWAAATLLSRAFSLDLADDQEPIEGDLSYFGSWQYSSGGGGGAVPDVLALVPWADMMRHSSEAGEWWQVGGGGGHGALRNLPTLLLFPFP